MAIHCCSGYQAIHCCSGYPQGNLGIHACWRLQPIRTPRPIPGLSPNGRSSSYLQLEFRRRVVRPPLDQRPTLPPPGALQLSRLQGCNSLKIHARHPFSEALTNQRQYQGITGGAILKGKPNCQCQLLAKRKPHCRHQLSRKNISGRSLTIVQKDLKRRSNVARAEVSCARELGESLRYTGAPVAAGWQQRPPPTPLHPSARTAATTIHSVPPPMPASKGPHNLLERNRLPGRGLEGSLLPAPERDIGYPYIPLLSHLDVALMRAFTRL